MPSGPPPTGPIDITCSYEQGDIDLIWAFTDQEFPDATVQQMQAKLAEWQEEGVRRGLRALIHQRRNSEALANKKFDDLQVRAMFGGS